MREQFQQALLARGSTILGWPLRPLSLGHLIILRTLNSPLVCGGQVTLADVAAAALVCSRAFDAARDLVFGQAAAWQDELRALGSDAAGASIDEALEAWRTYAKNHTECPLRWESDEQSEECRAPWEFHLVVFLCETMHMSEGAAWDCPINLARCYFDTWMDKHGDKSIVSDHEKAMAPWIGQE